MMIPQAAKAFKVGTATALLKTCLHQISARYTYSGAWHVLFRQLLSGLSCSLKNLPAAENYHVV